MPTREQLIEFAKEADAAGDYEAAERAFDEIAAMKPTASGVSNPEFNEGVASPFAEQRREKFNPAQDPAAYIWNKLKSGVSSGVLGGVGLLSDIEKAPGRFLGKLGFPGLESAQNQDYMQGTRIWTEQGDKILDVDRTLKPTDPATQYAGGVAEFTGASVIPSAAVISKAKKVVPATASEAGGITLGGAGAEFGGDLAEDAGANRAVGAIPLGITTATAGYGIPTLATKAGAAKNKFQVATSNKAGKELREMVSAEGLQNKIDDSFITADAIESVTGREFTPTLGGRTQSKYIENLERETLGRNTQSAELASSVHKHNIDTLQSLADQVLPEASKSLQRIAGERAAKASKNIEEAAETLAATRGAISKGYLGKDQQSIGTGIKDKLTESVKRFKKKSDEELKEIYRIADENKVKGNMDDVAATVRRVSKQDKNIFQTMPPIFGEVLSRYKKVQGKRASELVDAQGNFLSKLPEAKSQPATFKEIHSLYKETNKLLRDKNTGFTNSQIHFLGELKDSLDKKIKTFSTEEFGEVGVRLAKWNDDYKNYVNTFRKNAAGKVLKESKLEDFAPSKVTEKFFTPEGVDEFKKIYSKDLPAMQMLEDGIIGLFAKKSGVEATGVIDPNKANLFISNNKLALDKLPELKKRLVNGKQANELLVNRINRLHEAKKAVSNGVLMQVAKVTDTAPLIEKALTDPTGKTLRVLSNTGEEGRKAVLHSLASAIPQVAKSKGLTMGQFISKNEKTLRPLLNRYGKEHFNNIKIVMEGMDMVTHGKPPVNPSLTKFNTDSIMEKTGTSLPSLQSQLRASAMYGFISPAHVTASLATSFWRKGKGEKAAKLQEYLLTNPKAARDFALATKSENVNVFGNSIRSHAYAAGIRSVLASSDDMSKKGGLKDKIKEEINRKANDGSLSQFYK